MAPPRGGRNKRKLNTASESGTSVADSEEAVDSSTPSASRPRRSRLPRRYFDDDYSPPPSKKRATNRETPVSDAQEEEYLKLELTKTPVVPRERSSRGGRRKSTNPNMGRPKKNPTPPRSKSRKTRQEEDVIYMDEDSEDEEEEESEEEFILGGEEDELEELDLDPVSQVLTDSEDTIFCPWIDMDPETIPKLDLPESSQDIPLPKHATMDAIEVYEILRSYHRTLRITPFTFEDFCAALISKNNSCIMAEIHMALLKSCLKSDDEEQTHYSVTETNNSANIMIHHMDTMTYAEILRQFIEAYPFSDSSVRDAINTENYPYVGYESKLVVLLFMSYRFLYSLEFKKVVNNVGKFQNDENCRVCGKLSGRVIGCTQCEAAFHVECSHLKPFPDILVCNICKRNDVRGVRPVDESMEKEPLRSQPIGRDRYGRFYWFIARRIIVQSLDETEIHYYSTPPQLYQLLKKLDRDYYERDLCDAFQDRIEELLEQMTLTVEMTSERRDTAIDNMMKKNAFSFDYADATIPTIYLHKDSMKRMAAILRDCSAKVEPKEEPQSDDAPESQDDVTNNDILPETMLGIHNGCLINTFWSGGASQEELVEQFYSQGASVADIDTMSLWRMGDEGNDQTFMTYYNYYSRNEMAESFLVRKKQTDKKKYMSLKFAQIDNFEWTVAKDRQFYGNSVLHTKFVCWTLSKIARRIPADLMHRKWPEIAKAFDMEVGIADNYQQLARSLLKLDAAARKTIFMPQWWNGLGQTKLERITVDQREQFLKEQQKVKKMEVDALAKELDDSFIRVNYSKPKWPNTYILRQKGETYRNAGKGVMGGWEWVAAKYVARRVPVPQHPQCPMPNEGSDEEIKIKSRSNRKSRRLEGLIKFITHERDNKIAATTSSTPLIPSPSKKCYSPSCRAQRNPNCYSPSCRNGLLIAQTLQKIHVEPKLPEGVLGEDRPWPIPEIQTFKSKKGGKSIFVLQKNSRILRRLIVTAGCQQVYMPGFSAGTKSNLLIWPYPAPRPTLDLCWKWQTLNARNLHAVALQLKIMWSSIKWNEFEPDDNHPDRRVVIDTPTHDERRRIVKHKEMPPYGQYERYQLEIEIIPLYDEQEDEDESWTTRARQTDSARTASTRKKRPLRNLDNRVPTSVRYEWVDGVTLKVYEIKDYWKYCRLEEERAIRKAADAARKAQKAKEDAERQRVMALNRSPAVPRNSSITTDRVHTPYLGQPPQRRSNNSNVGLDLNGPQKGYLERYNTSQVPPRNTGLIKPVTPSPHRVQPNPIRKIPVSSLPQFAQQELHKRHQLQRTAAGSDYGTGGSPVVMSNNGGSYQSGGSNSAQRQSGHNFQYPVQTNQQQHQQQPQQHVLSQYPPIQRSIASTSNGYHGQHQQQYQNGGGGQPQPTRRVIVTQYRQPQTQNAIAEEAYSPDQPPVILRYDAQSTSQAPPPQPHARQVYTTQQVVRTAPAGAKPGTIVYVKNADGGLTQRRLVRREDQDSGQYPPGTVLQGQGPRLVHVRTTNGGAPATRQLYMASGNAGPRFRPSPTTTGTVGMGMPRAEQRQLVRKVVHRQPEQMDQVYNDHPSPQQQPHPQPPTNPRFVIQHAPPKISNPRGGMTMQMGQQQHQLQHNNMPQPQEFQQDPMMIGQEEVPEASMDYQDPNQH
ncbi:hypothetical protein L5515_013594 [Caenorhabditis briggsae]|uniref:DDT domain-containing protein n=1 Tax=Caenorhabditis briggsae TaxID=6238 RepID=A0AAE9EAQ4_CAEBR|nr:hypothetical protein L5515_013594 [Caenorhabditis briggsae]